MISYVNEHLFEVVQYGNGTWARDEKTEEYERYAIKTSDMVTRARGEGNEPEVFQKILAMFNDAGHGNTRIMSNRGGEHNTLRVTVKRSSDTKFDSDIFMIAIPFGGFVVPIEASDDLDIFKGLIVKSDTYIDHVDGERYKKIMYAAVRPFHKAVKLYDSDSYADSADFVVTFARSNRTRKDQDTSKLKWKMRTVRVKFMRNGEYHITEETTEIPFDQFDPEQYKGTNANNIFPIVEPRVYNKDQNA